VRGRRQGLSPLYRSGAATVAHGARALPPGPTTAGTWPHWPVLPTVRGTPNAVPHGGRCTFHKNFDSAIYFSKIITK
jgi:hypothetical protein